MTTGMVERAGLNDAEADALRVLANICIGTPDCHIRREDANAWFNYMSRLEKERSELRSALTAEAKQAERLRQALVHSVSLIQEWHNIGMSPKVASDTWDIYWRNAPELKPIRAAMEKANG